MTDKEQTELDGSIKELLHIQYLRGKHDVGEDAPFWEQDGAKWKSIDEALATAILDWRDKAMALAEAKARMGMLEYYDQVPSNDATDWKGLLADNRKQLEYELERLSQRPADKEEG